MFHTALSPLVFSAIALLGLPLPAMTVAASPILVEIPAAPEAPTDSLDGFRSILDLPEPEFVPVLTPESVITGLPEYTLWLEPEAGYCPIAIAFWQKYRAFEGGNEIGLLLETSTLTQGSWFMVLEETRITFTAPLQDSFADCVATENLELNLYPYYQVEIAAGTIQFRVDLDEVADGITTEASITDGMIFSQRPYVQWAIAD